MKTLATVFAAAVTPMNRDETIDFGALSHNTLSFVASGLRGVLALGGTGEFVSLSHAERLQVAEAFAKGLNGRASFLVGCGAETTKEAILYAQHAESIGADGVMLIASYYFKPSATELVTHMRTVADAVGIPVMLYNNPGSCGSDLTPELVATLCRHPNIRAIKEATGDLSRIPQLKAMCQPDFNVLCGCDYLLPEIVTAGGNGWVSITANALPGQSQRMFDAAMRGEDVTTMFQQLLPLYTLCEQPYKAIQTVKYMMTKLGFVGGESRLPRLPLTAQEAYDVDTLLANAGLL